MTRRQSERFDVCIFENISEVVREFRSLGSLLRKIRKNMEQVRKSGNFPAILYGEPTHFTAQKLADFARNGPLFKEMIKEGIFEKIILKAKDGIVEITKHGVVVR